MENFTDDILFARLPSPPPLTLAVTSAAVLFDGSAWAAPATDAVFVTEAGAVAPTSTISEIAGYAPPGASTSDRVQTRFERVQLHPPPEIDFAISPAGNVSVTVTSPTVAASPAFVTAMEYNAPVCPRLNEPW